MHLISTRTTLLIGITSLAAGLFISFAFPLHDRIGSLLLGFGVAALAIAIGKLISRKRPA
ncbi:hypothetical protein DCC81_09110 [Chitinophaga parva]|uniref:Uncharacterized protein n=1 Tax=Chitinophaga parva TaxID=2169414 RepID=A0A2T7BPI2_9BACT|nr:hypothetical protein [Chitinophaga parva]PUZ29585.1 hypothetical protein DCC81_09110 [Chitinophaga parva]